MRQPPVASCFEIANCVVLPMTLTESVPDRKITVVFFLERLVPAARVGEIALSHCDKCLCEFLFARRQSHPGIRTLSPGHPRIGLIEPPVSNLRKPQR
jgi:hypothetical protein